MTQIKNISQTENGRIVLSHLKQFERKAPSDGASVKMVLSGVESYNVDGNLYNLQPSQYLVVDDQQPIDLCIDSEQEVTGLCLFPDKSLINQIANAYLSSCEALLNDPFKEPEQKLTHNQLRFSENRTGIFLKQNVAHILDYKNRTEAEFDAFYIKLAECMVEDQLVLEGQLKNISSVRKATKEELYRRVLLAKDYIEDHYTSSIDLDDLAQKAFLSKYHFIRTFKSIFKVSPYQYLLQLRLLKAQELLTRDYSYNEISYQIGFSDGRNLRKAIKKWNMKFI